MGLGWGGFFWGLGVGVQVVLKKAEFLVWKIWILFIYSLVVM